MQRDRRLLKPLKLSAAILLAGLVALIGILVTRPDPHAQVEATFARIQTAFADGDARGLLAEIDPAYDLRKHWPFLSDHIRTMDDDSSRGESPFRRQLRAQLGRYFLYTSRSLQVAHDFRYEVHEVVELDDPPGTIAATVTIQLVGKGGRLPKSLDPALAAHPFRLVSQGWLFPQTRIIDHDPISL